MKRSPYAAVWKLPAYRRDLIATLISRFGDSVDAIAYSWLMYEVTKNASFIALILALNQLPTIFLQPLAAALVERWEKKKVVAFTNLGRGAVVLCTLLLYLTGRISGGYLMAATLITSTFEAFSIPAGSALAPMLVPQEQLTAANSLSKSASTLVELAGTAVAGPIIALLGLQAALALDLATFVLSSPLILLLPFREELEHKPLTLSGYGADLAGGFRYLRTNRPLLGIIVIGMGLNAANVPLSSFSPIYIAEDLHLGAAALSAFNMAMTVGILLGSVAAPRLQNALGIRRGLVLAGFLFPLFYFPAALLPSAPLSPAAGAALFAAAIFLMGLGFGVTGILFNTAFVLCVDRTFMARVSGITNALLTAMMPVVALLCSGLALFLPVTAIFFACGILLLLLYTWVARGSLFNALDIAPETEPNAL